MLTVKVNSLLATNNLKYLTNTFIANLKDDYEILLRQNINADIEEDFNQKLALFLGNAIKNDVAQRDRRKRQINSNKSHFGMNVQIFNNLLYKF